MSLQFAYHQKLRNGYRYKVLGHLENKIIKSRFVNVFDDNEINVQGKDKEFIEPLIVDLL